MLSLILKDILVQKKMIIFALGYAVFILIAFQNPAFVTASYIMGAMAISYLFILGACAYDNKSEVILNSLPIKRKRIVLAKYISVFFFAAGAIITIGTIGAVMKAVGLPFPHKYISIVDVLGTMVSIILLTSFYLPIYFRYGYIKSRVFNVLMFLAFFFAPNLIVEYVKENYDKAIIEKTVLVVNSQPLWVISLGIAAFMIILMYISFRLAVYFYKKRDF